MLSSLFSEAINRFLCFLLYYLWFPVAFRACLHSMVSSSSSHNGPRRHGRPCRSGGSTVGRRGGSVRVVASAVLTDRSIVLRGVSSSHIRSSSRFGRPVRRSRDFCERSPDLLDLAAQSGLNALLFRSIRIFACLCELTVLFCCLS